MVMNEMVNRKSVKNEAQLILSDTTCLAAETPLSVLAQR